MKTRATTYDFAPLCIDEGVAGVVSAIQKFHRAGPCIRPIYLGIFLGFAPCLSFSAYSSTISLFLQAKKADLPKRFLDRLQLHHAIVLPRTDRPLIGRGGIPLVLIEVEKRQGNR